MAMLKKLYEEKQKSVRSEKNMFIRMRKIRLFLQQRGFETELIQEIMKQNK
jgi:SOS response regulatory protein OraA/RecX